MTTSSDSVSAPDSPAAPHFASLGGSPSTPAPSSAPGDPAQASGLKPALSPSRASDFMQCPLLYRFRVIDRLPEPPSPAALRGTLVHSVAQHIFDLPAAQRTVQAAHNMIESQWQVMLADDPSAADVIGSDKPGWRDIIADLLSTWFELENPQALEPLQRELFVSTTLDSGLTLRGYVDRIDVAPDGRIRVVDYKTGRSPGPGFENKALFQMKFYGLVLWRERGVVPDMLQLVYLGNGQVVRHVPDEAALQGAEHKIDAIWQAITRAYESEDWRPNPGPLCGWCHHKPICPAWNNTP